MGIRAGYMAQMDMISTHHFYLNALAQLVFQCKPGNIFFGDCATNQTGPAQNTSAKAPVNGPVCNFYSNKVQNHYTLHGI